MNTSTHLLPRRKTLINVLLGVGMVSYVAYQLYSSRSDSTTRYPFSPNYPLLTLIALAGLYRLWDAIDPLKMNRLRTVSWDDHELVVKFPYKTKKIPWDSLKTITEDQIAFHLHTHDSWSGTELSKKHLPPELTEILVRKSLLLDTSR
ncbi:hypothetical protein [Luteolibacter sp. AS25]|uniref:hypothetical protein n=1 Tax=Luteolibacter sp. AS25 TaxID=3135776 RepID=UPI00398A8917